MGAEERILDAVVRELGPRPERELRGPHIVEGDEDDGSCAIVVGGLQAVMQWR